ncbi:MULTISPECIES: alcohol dehydrogenase catalytic domain-containing protein [unclassified Corynebacterium]|uniref:alcohol dehydrogenase catalytic domain-containing protein n=2 Tax=unclassified Corynebacterium TaxID=2624378 RepID=UPI002649CBE8|nr:alcohol dehydrogenase catalytic domain-containing protein [Corynebacterium sp.]MDN5583022.1 alcohol dehydrogenase catalytic domain-containing protein [Corynebacterium sp.]MDN5720590.1 alcohol dehydrogenase catalytic domain-containing protein [Corynebacterium sp.]MDN6510620.1 alcohol dehydrogenase catalytic domain-containing protein [Corynebacterium sp.]
MRAVTFTAKDTVEVQDRPVPEIQADEVLLKVSGAGLCHSDLHIIGTDDSPLIGATLGHEVAGVVEKTGEAVTGWEKGDSALVALVLSCGECNKCLAGRDNECEVANPRGAMAPVSPGIGSPGGMAEYIAVKTHHLDPLGDLDPTTSAPLADAALTPMHAVNSIRDRLVGGATVVTIGLGGLGHVGLQILAATTGARIIALDTDASKVEYAASHGADLALPSDGDAAARILEETGGRGADVVLDFVGVQPTVDLALSVVGVGGAIRFVGLGGGEFGYNTAASPLEWGVNIERAYGGTRADMRQAVALVQQGKLHVETTTYPLEDAARAFDDLRAGTVAGRIVLVP